MKGVRDIFISKEKLAVFWFLMACGCIFVTAYHLHTVAIEGRSRMLYVPVEMADVYIDRTLNQQELDELIDFQTRLALETLLNRGPRGPVTADRIVRLFTGEGLEQVLADVRESRYDFDTRQIHQMVELGEVRAQHNPDGSAVTSVTGQVVRISIDPAEQKAVNQSFTVRADMNWERNRNMRDTKRFLFVCNHIKFLMKEISSSEK
jgi:uncharacterized membrane protein YjgN (DUF898 family)